MVVELVVFLQGFAKLYGGGEGIGEGRGCAKEGVRLPSHLLTIYRGKGRGRGTLGLPLGGGGQGRLDLPMETLGGGVPPT